MRARHVLGDQRAGRRGAARAVLPGHDPGLSPDVAARARPPRSPAPAGRSLRAPRGRRRAPGQSGARAASPGRVLLATARGCPRATSEADGFGHCWSLPTEAAPSSPITTSTVPTGTTSPSATRIARPRPAAGDGISTVVLSVWISTSGSSSAISWPSATSQRATSPSVSPSPRSGSLNSYAIGPDPRRARRPGAPRGRPGRRSRPASRAGRRPRSRAPSRPRR